jgi:hypothetical protein
MFLRLVALRRSRPLALEDEASSFAHIRDDIVVVDVVGIVAAVVDVVGIPEVDAVGVGPMLDS